MKYCPLCGHKVEAYHEVTFDKPYIHDNPYDGLYIYGAFSAPKSTICFEKNFLHFAFYDAQNNLVDHRLVQLGVENPTTKTETFLELQGDDYHDYNEDELPF